MWYVYDVTIFKSTTVGRQLPVDEPDGAPLIALTLCCNGIVGVGAALRRDMQGHARWSCSHMCCTRKSNSRAVVDWARRNWTCGIENLG
jgi:hypothetical protein